MGRAWAIKKRSQPRHRRSPDENQNGMAYLRDHADDETFLLDVVRLDRLVILQNFP